MIVVMPDAMLTEHTQRAREVVFARLRIRPADTPRARVVAVVLAPLDVERGVADPPPASLERQLLYLQANRIARCARRTTHTVALAVHKPVGLTRIEALVALRRAAQGWW